MAVLGTLAKLARGTSKKSKKKKSSPSTRRGDPVKVKQDSAVDQAQTPEAKEKLRKQLRLPPGVPVKPVSGSRVVPKIGGKDPVLRGVSAKELSNEHSTSELNKMIKSLRTGRMGEGMSAKEKASQINRLERAIAMNKRVEKDVAEQMKSGQRRFDPDTGEELYTFRKGGMTKPKKKKMMGGGMAGKKAAAKKKKPEKTKWLFGFKK